MNTISRVDWQQKQTGQQAAHGAPLLSAITAVHAVGRIFWKRPRLEVREK